MKLSNLATITALIYGLIEIGELIVWKYNLLVKNYSFLSCGIQFWNFQSWHVCLFDSVSSIVVIETSATLIAFF